MPIACLSVCGPYGSPSRYPFFFFNDTATTEIYTLSLHDALPIFRFVTTHLDSTVPAIRVAQAKELLLTAANRSEEHTSELQSPDHLVCRLLLEKKKKIFDREAEANSELSPSSSRSSILPPACTRR